MEIGARHSICRRFAWWRLNRLSACLRRWGDWRQQGIWSASARQVDLRKINVPVLVCHGDDDQIVPIVAAARKSVKLLKQGVLKVWSGGDHGYSTTHQDAFNQDVLAFIEGKAMASAA